MNSQKQSTSGGGSFNDGSNDSDVAKSKRVSSLRRGPAKAGASRTRQGAAVIATTSQQTHDAGRSTATPRLQQPNQQPVQYIVVNSARSLNVGSASETMPQQQYHRLTPQSQALPFSTFLPHPHGGVASGPSFPFAPAQASTSAPIMYDSQRSTMATGLRNPPQQQQWGQMQLLPVHFMPVSTSGMPSAAGAEAVAPFRPGLANFGGHANLPSEMGCVNEVIGGHFIPLENAPTFPSQALILQNAPAGGPRIALNMLPVRGVQQHFSAAFQPSQFSTLSVPLQQQSHSASPALSPAINITSVAGDNQSSPSYTSAPRSRNSSSLAQRAASSANSSNPNLSPQHSIATPSSGNTPAVSPLSPRQFHQQQQQYQQQQQQQQLQSLHHQNASRPSAAVAHSNPVQVTSTDEMDEDNAVDNDDTSSSFAESNKNNVTLNAFLLDADDTDETFLDDELLDGTSSNFADSSASNAASRSAALQQFRERRRAAHLQAEKKRRNSIQHGFQELKELLPPLPSEQGGGAGLLRATKAVVLQRAVSYCEMLRKTNSQSGDKLAKLRQESEGLEIMRDQLQQFVAQAAATPQNNNDSTNFIPGSESTSTARTDRQQHTNVSRPNSSADDAELYFDVFRGFADALFTSYNRVVSTQDFKSISGTSIQWLEQYCGPQATQRQIQQAANQVTGGGRVVDVQAGMQ